MFKENQVNREQDEVTETTVAEKWLLLDLTKKLAIIPFRYIRSLHVHQCQLTANTKQLNSNYHEDCTKLRFMYFMNSTTCRLHSITLLVHESGL
jgi:hypothetical protein